MRMLRAASFTVMLTVVAAGCAPGQWRGFHHATGETLCSPCPEGFYCPDGERRLLCEAGTRTVGEGGHRCCPESMTCADRGSAVTSDCLCRPIECERGLALMQGASRRYFYECANLQGCATECPAAGNEALKFVQTAECQCVLWKPCDGQAWRWSDPLSRYHYECV